MNFKNTSLLTKIVLLLAIFVVASCSPTRYHEPKKPHNHYRSKSKNKWMEEKRRNMQQF
jgi:cyclic lactone autoinducer peptide